MISLETAQILNKIKYPLTSSSGGLMGKALDFRSESCECKSQHCQAASFGPLSKAFNPVSALGASLL